jgi:hypothetical protein
VAGNPAEIAAKKFGWILRWWCLMAASKDDGYAIHQNVRDSRKVTVFDRIAK